MKVNIKELKMPNSLIKKLYCLLMKIKLLLSILLNLVMRFSIN